VTRPRSRPRPRDRSFLLSGLLGAAVLICAAVVCACAWIWVAWAEGGPPSPTTPDTMRVRIRPGMTLQDAADTLVELGLLRHERVFKLGARLEGRDRDLRPGVFAVAVGAPPRDLLRALVDVTPLPVVVTVPEGLEAAEVADLAAAALGFPARDFLAAADKHVAEAAQTFPLFTNPLRRSAFARTIADTLRAGGRRLHWCEGYLAPDTYHFYEGTTAELAARTMVELQLARLDSALALCARRPGQERLSPQDLVTLASIVEAEAWQPPERPRVAAVYTNRLRAGMRLEADPTVAFWLRKRGQRLFYSDLKIGSPFNTYLRPGLPPGPIGSPGWLALMAAALPDTTCRALYFVADGRGGHVFSLTLEQHNRAVQVYRDQRQRAGVDGHGTTR
jgi:UPF0755 protein